MALKGHYKVVLDLSVCQEFLNAYAGKPIYLFGVWGRFNPHCGCHDVVPCDTPFRVWVSCI